MITRLKLLLIFTFLGFTVLSFSQAVLTSESISDEADVRDNNNTIVITITGDTFVSGVGSDDGDTDTFLGGFTGGSSAWNTVISDIIALSNSQNEVNVTNGDSVVTISIDAASDYYISSDEAIGFTIPAASLTSSTEKAVTGTITVTNQVPTLSFTGGTLNTGSVNENDIRSSSYTFKIDISTDNAWRSDMESAADALTAVKGIFSNAPAFDALVTGLSSGNLDVSGNTLTITFFSDINYYLSADENVDVDVTSDLLEYPENISNSTTNFDILNWDPVISIGGTISEAEIQTGTSFTISLSGDTWDSPLSGDFVSRIIGSGTEWNSDVLPSQLNAGRTNLSTVTVNITATPGYSIDAAETLSITIDAGDLNTYRGVDLAVSGTITIEPSPSSLSPSITPSTLSEGDIRGDTYDLELTVNENTWDADISSNSSKREDLINSIVSSVSETSFDNLITAIINQGASGVDLSGDQKKVTITIPALGSFNIGQSIDLSFSDVPGYLFTQTTGDLSSSTFLTITAITPKMNISTVPSPLVESDITGALLTVKLEEETFNGTLNISNFDLLGNPPQVIISASSPFNLVSSDSLTIELELTGNIDNDFDLGLEILAAELVNGLSDLSNTSADIEVSAELEPDISLVTIDDAGMGFGTTVTATISVEDDQGNLYSLEPGSSIAERSLYNLRRDGGSHTSYLVDFDIGAEGTTPEYNSVDVIPVDIQVNNGSIPGNPYTTPIDQLNDPIDTHAPVLNTINFNNGNYTVGDQITALVIVANNEAGLEFDESVSTINMVPFNDPSAITTYESGFGSYQVFYTIQDGNNSTSDIDVNIVMTDHVGNPSAPLTSYSGTSPVIVGSVPIINSITVSSTGIKTPNPPNNEVVLTIDADATGLLLSDESVVNHVDIPSGSFNFVEAPAYTYTLTYTIGPDDDEVLAANTLTANIILVDGVGNEIQSNTLSPNDIRIYTALPSGNIYGGGSMCEGDSVEIFIDLEGRGPFDITVLEDAALYDIFYDIPADFSFYVQPGSDKTYTLSQVTDIYGNSSTPLSNTNVKVNPNPAPSITNTRTSFQVSESAVQLTADSLGGQFTGPGVITSESKFYPGNADTINSPHTIYYTYVHPPTGCVGIASAQFSVLSARAEILDLPDVICYNEPPITITGSITGTGSGIFTLEDQKGNDMSGSLKYIDINQAELNVDNLFRGTYKVVFTYDWDGKPGYEISRDFILDDIAEVKFDSRPDTTVCINNLFTKLHTNLDETGPNYIYEGDGVSYSFSESAYIYNPADAPLDRNKIVYTFTSDRGCIRKDSFETINYDVPEVYFEPEDICIAVGGTEIFFEFDTVNKKLVDKWMWYFNDGDASEAENRDTIFNISGAHISDRISHFYENPVNRTVSLEMETKAGGCSAIFDSTIVFGLKPQAVMDWSNDCYTKGNSIYIENLPRPQGISLDSISWHIYDAGFSDLDSIRTNESVIDMAFPKFKDYYIELQVWTDLGCSDTSLDSIILKPTIRPLVDSSYFETFNSKQSIGKWSTDKFTTSNSWVHDELDWVYDSATYNKFTIDDGDLSWYIRKEVSDTIEDSWIQSPCFNFDSLERPMIRFDMMRSFDETWDGAVLQYTLNNGDTWTRVGEISEGINWYNLYNIEGNPGGSQADGIGWSGEEVFSPDTNWVNVAHDLDELRNKKGVIFGIFYGNAIRTNEDNKGIAVDNVYIGERTKRALIEHFTDAGYSSATAANEIIDDFTEQIQNSLDVTNLQYHLHYSGEDPMNENNPAPASSRSFYYGISGIPYALMDGGLKPSYQYDFVSTVPTSDQLRELTLESPIFELDIKSWKYSERLATTVDVRALQDYDASDVVLYVVVVEKEAEYEGEIFKNVVLDMLPNPAGTVYSQEWYAATELIAADEERFEYSWRYVQGVEKSDDLMIVAFIQERGSGKVLQTASQNVIDVPFPSAVSAQKLNTLRIYPNPASHLLNVEFDEAKYGDVVLEVTDMTGRSVLVYELYEGDQHIQLHIAALKEGAYILQSKENDRVSSRTNFIKVR